jgi:glycosyltransferase 2 family protein
MRKTGTTVLKLVLSAVLLYFVYTKINLMEIKTVLGSSRPGYLFIALLLFIGSKLLAAFRLNLYFKTLGIRLLHSSNLKLYALGMFYNLFLPGGIGGDAYKGYRIKKAFGTPIKKVLSVLVLDRLSGLLALFLLACLLLYALQLSALEGYDWLALLLVPVSIGFFWMLGRRFFPYTLSIFWRSLSYSLGRSIGATSACVLCILMALSTEADQGAYLLVFLVSSIVSVLPLTLGGIGSREVTFYYGAELLRLQETRSIAISITFFLITALVSLMGIIYHFKQIDLVLDSGENSEGNA